MLRRENDEINNYEDDCGLDEKSLSKDKKVDINRVNGSEENNDNNQNQEKKASISEIIFGIAFLLLIVPVSFKGKHSNTFAFSNEIISIMWAIAIGLLLFNWIFLKDKASRGCLKYLLLFILIAFVGGWSVYLLISSMVNFLNR